MTAEGLDEPVGPSLTSLLRQHSSSDICTRRKSTDVMKRCVAGFVLLYR